MLKLTFHPDVSCEVKASYNWYQEKTEGLGEDLMKELESAYQTIDSCFPGFLSLLFTERMVV